MRTNYKIRCLLIATVLLNSHSMFAATPANLKQNMVVKNKLPPVNSGTKTTTIATSVPKQLQLSLGKKQNLNIKGALLNRIRGARLTKDRNGKKIVSRLKAVYRGNSTKGRFELTLAKPVAAGSYFLFASNGKANIALVPIKVTVPKATAKQKSVRNIRTVKKANPTISAKDKPPVISRLTSSTSVKAGRPFTVSFAVSDNLGDLLVNLSYTMNRKTITLKSQKIKGNKASLKWKVIAPKTAGIFDLILSVVDSSKQKTTKTLKARTSVGSTGANSNANQSNQGSNASSRNSGSQNQNRNRNQNQGSHNNSNNSNQNSGVPFRSLTVNSEATLSMTGRGNQMVEFTMITINSTQPLSMTGRGQQVVAFTSITINSQQTLSMTGKRQ